MSATPPLDPRFRLLSWVSIVNQLATTQANRVLDGEDLPFPQFTALLHFEARGEASQTVTDVAAAFQQPQPGVTKTLRKLEDKGYLAAQPHPTDRRARLLALTPEGRTALVRARAALEPVLDRCFKGWDSATLAAAFAHLDRLKTQLDPPR